MKIHLSLIASLMLGSCAPSTSPLGCANNDIPCLQQEKLRHDADIQKDPNPLRKDLERINRETVRG